MLEKRFCMYYGPFCGKGSINRRIIVRVNIWDGNIFGMLYFLQLVEVNILNTIQDVKNTQTIKLNL